MLKNNYFAQYASMATAGVGAETTQTQNEIRSDETRLVPAEEGKHNEV